MLKRLLKSYLFFTSDNRRAITPWNHLARGTNLGHTLSFPSQRCTSARARPTAPPYHASAYGSRHPSLHVGCPNRVVLQFSNFVYSVPYFHVRVFCFVYPAAYIPFKYFLFSHIPFPVQFVYIYSVAHTRFGFFSNISFLSSLSFGIGRPFGGA